MAITFTNARYFQTDVGSKIFQNVPLASLWFKLLVTSKTVVNGSDGQCGFLSKVIFDIWHQFIGLGTPTTIPLRFVCTNSAGSFAQSPNMSLTLGVVYGIAVTWDGVNGSQKVWISGIPTQFGVFKGNTQNNSSALQIGVSDPSIQIVYTLDDPNCIGNYLFTASDIAYLLNGGDPTTIGPGALPRQRWTLAGTTGQNATIGDAGLKNAYGGGGSLASGGDGSDCITAGGAGTAVYAPSLVWSPTVAPNPAYVDTCGKVVAVFFESLVNGSQVSPSQLLVTPTITQNDGSPVSLGTPWFTGYHPMAWYPLPPGMVIAPGDTVTLSAPTAWANTPAGSVEGMNNLAITNRSTKSVVRPDNFTPTLPVGVNNSQDPVAIWGFYTPLKNWKYRTYGGLGKYSAPTTAPIYANTGVNGIDATNYPGPAGTWLVMWDTGTPANTTQFGITTPTPATTAITERMDLKASPGSGIGMCRAFDVEHVSTTGSADLSISLTLSGTVDYSNLWIVGPGDFDIVNGAVVLDRSDPMALSRVYADRVPSNVGSLRWVDSTIGGDPHSFPFPEKLRSITNESWGDISFIETKIGYTAVGPVDTTITPYIYSQFLGKPGANGQTFTATLASPITTTPTPGTHETWVFTDGATAPLLAGLELEDNSETIRLISQGVDQNHWTVYRGSAGTTPATHAAGPVTVYGRIPITTVLSAGGGIHGGLVWQITTAVPHGITTGAVAECDGNLAYPPLTFSDGETLQLFSIGRPVYVTGPNTFFMAIEATGGGATLPAPITLNPSNYFWDQRWPPPASMPHEACAIITGKFPNANLHVNIWPDACDDLVYEIARRVLANFPSGRKVYVEYNNEPWNQRFGTFYYHTGVMSLIVPGTYQLRHYAWRAFQVHDIFRVVFAAAGRGGEIMGILNCQMAGPETPQYLSDAIAKGKNVDAIAIAPYVSTEDTPYNDGVINTLDDEQAISLFTHDIWYNTRTYNSYVTTTKGYIQAYNTASGNDCLLIGYEGGVEFCIPNNASITNHETRNHDCVTNPNFYLAEGDFYALVQSWGFDHFHVYALAMFWNPEAWGQYHGILQDHGRGDGSDGKFNNLLCRANPASPHYKGANVNQDGNTVSVRGQALIDWLNGVADVLTGAAGLMLQGDTITASCMVNVLTQGLADLVLHDDTASVQCGALKTTKADPLAATKG